MKYQLISLSVISILILSGCNLTSFLESENKSSTVQQVDEILLEAPLHSYPPVPLAASAFTNGRSVVIDMNVLSAYDCPVSCTFKTVSDDFVQEAYINNLGDGVFKAKNISKQLELSQNLKSGIANGLITIEDHLNDIKIVGTIINDNYEGTLYSYKLSTNSLISSEEYKNGKLNGEKIIYDQYGNTKTKGNYVNGILNGKFYTYYSSGAVEGIATFKNGRLVGTYNNYYENGRLKQQGYYTNGLESGATKIYMEDGALWASVTYSKDKPIAGKCANGRKWTKAELLNWENGLQVNCTYYINRNEAR